MGCDLGGGTRSEGLCRQAGDGAINVAARVIGQGLVKCLSGIGDQNRLPEMVGEADPALGHILLHNGLTAPFRVNLCFGDVIPIGFREFAVGDGNCALVQDEEVFQIVRLCVLHNHAVGGQRDRCLAIVGHRLRH